MNVVRKLSLSWKMYIILATMSLFVVGSAAMSLIDDSHRNGEANRVVGLTRTSRALLKTILAMRLERGAAVAALSEDHPVAEPVRANIAALRRQVSEGMQEATALIEADGLPGVDGLLQAWRAADATTAGMRVRADAALDRPAASREPRAKEDVEAAYVAELSAIRAVSDAVDNAIPRGDPALRRYLAVKQAAWETRVAVGEAAFRIQLAVAAAKPWSQADMIAAGEERGRVAPFWARVRDNAGDDLAPTLRTALQTANRENFEGTAGAERRALIETLNKGLLPDVDLQSLRSRDTARSTTIVDLAFVALDEMVGRAESLAADARTAMLWSFGFLVAFVGLATVGFVVVSRGILRPIQAMTACMRHLADGHLDTDVPFTGRHDEIGAMAATVLVFKTNALAVRQHQAVVETMHRDNERKLEKLEGDFLEAAKTQDAVVAAMAASLAKLSEGDLVYRLDSHFSPEYDKIKADFNAAMERLQDTMRSVSAGTILIRAGTGEISAASDDLSRRTEQQAASLEETAAALDEITVTVRKTAEASKHARTVVGRARSSAEHSGLIMRQAVQAMDGIERSSAQVTQIIGVIDEIAFQTNLLALNAGVEAARAGEAGRGFAVVASEVRALAQRSAEAAKEIKGLISASGRQVEEGVAFVGQTGEALSGIVAQVAEIDAIVGDIAASAQEQATALDEVNTAMNQMDQVTQQNAAMVEEATAASRALSKETLELSRLVGTFQVGAVADPRPDTPARSREAARPAAAPVRTLRAVGRGGAAPKPDPSAEGWIEF